MKTKMYIEKVVTKLTNSSLNSLLIMAFLIISCGMYGQQNRPLMPWGNSRDPNRTGGVDYAGGNKGTLIQANDDNSNDPEENIYFRVAGSSDWRWFYDPQMVITPDKIYLNRTVQTNGALFTTSGDIFTKSGNLYTQSGDFRSNKGHFFTNEGNIYSNKGYLFTDEGSIFSRKGHLYTESGHLFTNGGNIYSNKGHLYTESGHLFTNAGNLYSKNGHLYTEKGHLFTNEGNLYSKKGNLYTELGDLSSLKGNVFTSEGNLYSKNGNIYTDNGYLKASKGVQTLGYLYAAGKVFLGGNFDASGTPGDPSTFYASNPILNKYSVFVQKGLLSEDYALAPQEDWADYVFTKTHVLKPLKEVDNFIKENGNLPNIPNAGQIAKEGYNLHEMNVKFLEKIEELTLYTIDQQKSLEQQQLAIVRLEKQVQELLAVAKKQP